jgi:EmrB/QacA subfamily drug resistance transporter
MARAAREKVNPPAEALYERKWKIFGVMMIGWSMSLIDISIVNIAVPELQRDLVTDTDSISWVINAYNITFAVLLVAMGRLADQFGRKRFFIIGMALFTLGSALCAVAQSVEALVFFRVIQGIGAGTLAPLGFAITVLVFPPQMRGRALALIAVVALVSTSVGPVLGAAILEVADWEWIFLVNVPFGLLGILLAMRVWPETWDLSAVGKRVDLLGMALLALAVFSLTFALAEANSRGWDDALILFLLQGSLLLAIAFFFSQRYGKASMIPPGLMGNRQFSGANIAMVLFGAGAFGTLFLLSLTFQNLWGYDPWEAALALLPVPVMGIVVWPFVAGGADRRPPRALAVPALASMVIGCIWFSFVPSTSETWGDYLIVLPGLLLIGAGIGAVFPSLNVGAMGAVSGPQLGLASGIVNTARQLGAAIGIALVVATAITASNETLKYAIEDIADANDVAELPPALVEGITMRKFTDYIGQSTARFDPGPGFDDIVARETAGAARDAFGWAFRIAALCALLAIPFARRMVRPPAEARAADAAAAAARAGQGGAPPPERAPPTAPAVPAPAPANGGDRERMAEQIAEMEATLAGMRAELRSPGAGDGADPPPRDPEPRRRLRRRDR